MSSCVSHCLFVSNQFCLGGHSLAAPTPTHWVIEWQTPDVGGKQANRISAHVLFCSPPHSTYSKALSSTVYHLRDLHPIINYFPTALSHFPIRKDICTKYHTLHFPEVISKVVTAKRGVVLFQFQFHFHNVTTTGSVYCMIHDLDISTNWTQDFVLHNKLCLSRSQTCDLWITTFMSKVLE